MTWRSDASSAASSKGGSSPALASLSEESSVTSHGLKQSLSASAAAAGR